MKVNEIVHKLKMNTLTRRVWKVQGTCAKTGDGLFDGLDWIGSEIRKH